MDKISSPKNHVLLVKPTMLKKDYLNWFTDTVNEWVNQNRIFRHLNPQQPHINNNPEHKDNI
jgi:hypothetical protein